MLYMRQCRNDSGFTSRTIFEVFHPTIIFHEQWSPTCCEIGTCWSNRVDKTILPRRKPRRRKNDWIIKPTPRRPLPFRFWICFQSRIRISQKPQEIQTNKRQQLKTRISKSVSKKGKVWMVEKVGKCWRELNDIVPKR